MGSLSDDDSLPDSLLLNESEIIEIIEEKYGFILCTENRSTYDILLQALDHGFTNIALYLLDKGCRVNCDDFMISENTALHIAVQKGYLKVVSKLLQRGADINVRDRKGNTPLLIATKGIKRLTAAHFKYFSNKSINKLQRSRNRSHLIVRLLLNEGADVYVLDNEGRTPLHFAVEMGCLNITKMLLDGGANVNVYDIYGSTPLFLAIQCIGRLLVNSTREIKKILKIKELRDFVKDVLSCCENDLVSLLLENSAVVNRKDDEGMTVLHYAVEKGSVALVQALLDKEAGVNVENNLKETPLMIALNETKSSDYMRIHDYLNHGPRAFNSVSSLAREAIVKLLLDNGANPNDPCENGKICLHYAVKMRSVAITRMLLDKGAQVDNETSSGDTPLLIASKWRELRYHLTDEEEYTSCGDEIIKLLLKHGANINKQNYYGLTPLHYAMERGSVDFVKMMLDNGAKVETTSSIGETPLLVSLRLFKCPEIVTILLKYGADINTGNKYGETPLRLLFKLADVDKNWMEQINIVLENEANVNCISPSTCYTPLMEAVLLNNCDIVELLLEKGADPNIRSTNDLLEGADGEKPIQPGLYSFAIMYPAKSFHNTDVDTDKPSTTQGVKESTFGKYLYKKWKQSERCITIGNTALHFAVEGGLEKVVSLLLQYGADVNMVGSDGLVPLQLNAIEGNKNICQMLLNKGASIEPNMPSGKSVLYMAVYNSQSEIVDVLLYYGAEISSLKRSASLLHLLNVIRGNYKLCLMLLNNFAIDVNDIWDGRHLLHYAVEADDSEVTNLLLEHGARAEWADAQGHTALHLASYENKINSLNTLLEFGAQVDAKDTEGMTPLHVACRATQPQAAKILLDYGADIDAEDNRNRSVQELLTEGWHQRRGLRSNIGMGFSYRIHNTHSEIWHAYIEISGLIEKHIEKRHSIDDFVSVISNKTDDNYCFENSSYEEELKKMYKEKIGGSTTSYFDFLVSGPNRLAILVKNREIESAFALKTYRKQFPIYASLISGQYWKGFRRRHLMNKSKDYLLALLKNVAILPLDCIEPIIRYLKDNDLRTIIIMFEFNNFKKRDSRKLRFQEFIC